MTNESAGSITSSPEARFRQVFQAFEQDWTVTEASLRSLYHPDVQFTDPLLRIRGRDRFIHMTELMHRGARGIETRLHRVVQDQDALFATWTWTIRPKLGPTVNIEGCSYTRWVDNQIVEQRDYWDIAGSVTACIPGLSRVGGMLRQRFMPS